MKHLISPALIAIALAACGQTEPETPAPAEPAPVEAAEVEAPVADAAEEIVEAAQAATEEAASLTEGEYCYLLQGDSSTEGMEIELNIAGVFSGRHYGTIHDEENAYFAAFETMLSDGVLNDEGIINFTAVTEVDGDTQYGEEPWVITAEGAHSAHWDDAVLEPADCDFVDATVWPPIPE